jgi:magnesium transporter
MLNNTTSSNNEQESYMLNNLIGTKVVLHGKKIGVLRDIVAKENGALPRVTHFFVYRPFGNSSLLIPWENIRSVTLDEIVINIPDIKTYEHEPDEMFIRLKDQILDKKVLDTEDRDVDVVYDIRLVLINNNLYVSDVDISRTGLLRRIGLEWIGKIIDKTPDSSKIISWKYIQSLPTPLGRFTGDVKLKVLKEKLSQIHPVDLADILEELDYKQRIAVFEELDTNKASATLEEIDPKAQRELISALKKEKIAQLLTHMTSGQAADILSVLPYTEVRPILNLMEDRHVNKIKAIMEKQEEEVINFSTSRFIKFHPSVTVGEVRGNYQTIAKGKRIIMYIYLVDEKEKLLGVVDIKELLLADENKKLIDIKIPTIISLKPNSSLKTALNVFERYFYRALPIVDHHGKILGVISYRDLKSLQHRFLE